MNLLSVIGTALPTVEVTLSRRNLRALLAKLDGHPRDSACTIYRRCERGTLIVTGEEDEVHYWREPGRMDPETERRMAKAAGQGGEHV